MILVIKAMNMLRWCRPERYIDLAEGLGNSDGANGVYVQSRELNHQVYMRLPPNVRLTIYMSRLSAFEMLSIYLYVLIYHYAPYVVEESLHS